jgi:hypothetical protein
MSLFNDINGITLHKGDWVRFKNSYNEERFGYIVEFFGVVIRIEYQARDSKYYWVCISELVEKLSDSQVMILKLEN